MNRSILKSLTFVLIIALLLVVLLNGRQTAAAISQPGPNQQSIITSSQGTEAQVLPAAFPGPNEQSLLAVSFTASFYNVPGSILTPVSSTTSLASAGDGCIYADAWAGSLLNAPLDIPPGSQIVLLRLYYDDTSASNLEAWITRYNSAGTDFEDLVHITSSGDGGHGSSYQALDHVTDTYNWRYVLNVRLNSPSPTLQVCGIRVMYYAPIIYGTFLPEIMRDAP
ncbi:MAG: hypothetical protein JW987_03475 [Anaerolineaceae bacterium]|nr:hypothetical protein [Anaerolineaceae bacterium]